ncbi:hypothetical protein [Haloarcula amylolytica]|uniref:Uncharacterized protein n=1 Tax=Haloarcula amylolytica JCM 13557 TaxID=1227452 RepID=M0K8B3_9EURY|nr:hypothetical protein [Haloarcula amylolytica]EMA17038.1 hypothetical protein C442_17250 [Haloarcula amylolytica JCM 13557]
MSTSLELVRGVPEHIRFYDDERSLCGADCTGGSARVVPDDQDPVAVASVYLCSDCADEWARVADETERESTVRCVCDRVEAGTIWKCARLVPASIARALHHPAADGPAPICPDCYEWIREHPVNSVEEPFDDAPSWTETVN